MITTTTDNRTEFEIKIEMQLAEIRQFIEKTMTTGEFRDEQEFWAEFSDEIDIQFSEDDDEASPFFGTMTFSAYPIIKDGRGNVTTDTSEFVIISGV